VQIIKDGDEYSTDLQKCIQHVEEMESGQGQDSWIPIVIYGGLSGRLDQTTAVLSLLHKLRQRVTSMSANPKHGDAKSDASATAHDRSIPGSVKLPTGEELYISYDADEQESGKRKARGAGKRDIRVINDDCIAWALDSVSLSEHDADAADFVQGTHEITIDHSQYGQTCGILPLGVQESRVSTKGLKWDFGGSHVYPKGQS
jgi:hypothetical protein